jgi:hypothetical protein
MQATCLARQGDGTSETDIYTLERRAESYHWSAMRGSRELQIVDRLGCNPRESGDAGAIVGSRLDGHPLGL